MIARDKEGKVLAESADGVTWTRCADGDVATVDISGAEAALFADLLGLSPRSPTMQKTLLTPDAAAARMGLARGTLAKMRMEGVGPAWVKIGASVRYPADTLAEWIASLPRRRSTGDTAMWEGKP